MMAIVAQPRLPSGPKDRHNIKGLGVPL